MGVTTLGIDVGKNTFHLVGLDQHGKLTLRKKATRATSWSFWRTFPPAGSAGSVRQRAVLGAALARTWA